MKFKQFLATALGAGLLVLGGTAIAPQSVQAAKTYGVSDSKPVKVNKAKHEVYLETTVNGTYLNQPTRHLIVNKDGANGNKSLLKTNVTPNQFYAALKKVGAKPGNNLTAKSKAGTKIKGTKLNVSFVINDKKVASNKAVQVKGKDAKNLDFRFGGNKAHAAKMKTGCIICFDSCPVGIASGATYGFSFGEHFTGKSSVLPKDGQHMVVVVKAATK